MSVSCASHDWSVVGKSDKNVRELISRIIDTTEVGWAQNEKRKDRRIAFPSLLTLTPLDDIQPITVGEPIAVVGKHLASRGLDFYHRDALPFKRAIVSFEDTPWDIHLLLQVSWCRFLRPGWYDSGGRFTHIFHPLE